jgi:opacity protein-like surface antigen
MTKYIAIAAFSLALLIPATSIASRWDFGKGSRNDSQWDFEKGKSVTSLSDSGDSKPSNSRQDSGDSKVGIDYVKANSEIAGEDFDTSALQIRFSKGVVPNIDVEGVFAFGIDDDTVSDSAPPLGDFSVTGELGHMFGVFAKFHSDSNSGFGAFARVGIALVEYDIDIETENFGSASDSFDDTGIAFGVGASFNFSETSAIVVEYSKLPDVDFEGVDIETDAISIGFQMSI